MQHAHLEGTAVLRPALAQWIAEELMEIAGCNVMITDAAGTVMGCGDDESRVGQFHEASVVAVTTRRTAVHTAEDVRGMVGTLPGITLPLIVGGDVVGTVALSGRPEEVGKLAMIVRRQTEILIQESDSHSSWVGRDHDLEGLLLDICNWHRSDVSEASIARNARRLNIDLALPRIVLVFESTPDESRRNVGGGPTRQSALTSIRSVFEVPPDMSAQLTPRTWVVATGLKAGNAAVEPALHNKIQNCLDSTTAAGFNLRVGLGSRAAGIQQLVASARDAHDALRLGRALNPTHHVFDIEQLRIYQALSVIPIEARERVSRSMLGPLWGEEDWPKLRETLIIWGHCGFNAARAAKQLNIHRNTFTYRFERISRLIGRRLDDPGVGVALYLSCVLNSVDM
jgi:carbohydrate diacid regulator